jgi:hypothetical protein
MDRNQEYIRLLQERNRMKKALTEKTSEEQQKEELEKGFSINFRGANAGKQNASKVLEKPVVKMHKGLAAEIAKRLLGPEDNEQPAAAAVSIKKRWASEGGDISSVLEDNVNNKMWSASVPRRREPDSDNEKSVGIHEDATSSSGKESRDMDGALLQRIKSMNADQKKALLDLLQISDPSTNGEEVDQIPDENSLQKSQSKVNVYNQLSNEEDSENPQSSLEDHSGREDAGNFLQKEDLDLPKQNPKKSLVSPSKSSNVHHYDWSSYRFILKVKVFSTWDNCKNCVLQAIRCRVKVGDQFLDILPSFKVQISCGLNILPSSMEVYRKLPVIVSSGHFSSSLDQWKGPVTLAQPLELKFEGSIVEPSNCSLSDYFKDMDSFLQSTQFFVWNGYLEDAGVNYSPVKDLDVYLEDKCIFSGQIDPSNAAVDVTKAASNFSPLLKYESNPSLFVPLVPRTHKTSLSTSTKTSDSTNKGAANVSVTGNNNVEAGNLAHNQSAASDNSFYIDIPSKGIRRCDDIFFDPPHKPVKIVKDISKVMKPSVLGAVVEEGVSDNYIADISTTKGIRRRDDIFFDSPPFQDSNGVKIRSNSVPSDSRMIAEEHDSLKKSTGRPESSGPSFSVDIPSKGTRRYNDISFDSPPRPTSGDLKISGPLNIMSDSSVPAKKPQSRGSRRNAQRVSQTHLEIIPESGESSPMRAMVLSSSSKNTTSTANLLPRQSSIGQLEDSMIRRSIDAVQRAEKFNLNRLENSKDIDKIYTNALAVDAQSSLSMHSPVTSPFAADVANSATTTISPIIAPVYYSPELTTAQKTQYHPSSLSPTSRLEKRAANIGEFSSKLSSKLQEVNGILAQLPRKPSLQLLPRADPVSAPPVGAEKTLVSQSAPAIHVSASSISPSGRVLCIWIFSTHGDNNYVGLNGIELFDSAGQLIPSSALLISAVPADLTILPGYEDDPRNVSNLLDGVNYTKDDLHQWLAPQIQVARDFVSEQDKAMLIEGSREQGAPLALIRLEFVSITNLAMIRIYNFNKSRTHNQRGVKTICIDFDGVVVFSGDVAKATGQTGKNKSEVDDCLAISLSTDVAVLDTIAAQTEIVEPGTNVQDESAALEESMVSVQSRPKTAAAPDDSLSQVALGDNATTLSFNDEPSLELADGEDILPTANQDPDLQDSLQTSSDFLNAILQETDAIQMRSAYQQRLQQAKSSSLGTFLQQKQQPIPEEASTGSIARRPSIEVLPPTSVTHSSPRTATAVTYVRTLSVRFIRLELLSTWGDYEYIGLGGIEVLNIHGHAHRLTKQMLRCENCVDAGFGVSDRSDLNQLLISGHDTADSHAMWLVPQDHERKKIIIDIDLQSHQEIIGLKIWNYNGTTMDEMLRGCRLLNINFDNGRVLMSNLLLRTGPLYDGVRFGQYFTFDRWIETLGKLSSTAMNSTMSSKGGPLSYITPRLKQTYEVLTPVSGLSFVFSFFSNHGDHYYVGLDKMEFLDEEMQVIDVLSLGEVTAVPYSVRDLANSSSSAEQDIALAHDPRIPPALFLHSRQGSGPQHSSSSSWLSPLAHSMLPAEREACVQRIQSQLHKTTTGSRVSVLPADNTLFVLAHFPVRIAAIRMWNYSKNPLRGVKEFCLTIDGNVMFMGSLLSATEYVYLLFNMDVCF